MSHTRHPEERGTPLAYRRWRRRNVPRTLGRADQYALADVAVTLVEIEELDTHDPELWLHGTNLVTYVDVYGKRKPREPRPYDPCDPYAHYGREETWYWDDWYDYRDDYDYDYREDDSYGGYDDVRYLDPREAAWVMAWLGGEVEADDGACPCCEYDYLYEDDYAEYEGEKEFFAREQPEPRVVAPEAMRTQEKKRAGDRYYRTFRRAA